MLQYDKASATPGGEGSLLQETFPSTCHCDRPPPVRRQVPAAHASRICARVATHAAAKVRGKARVHHSAALVDSCDRAQSLGRQIELQWPPSIIVEHYAKDKDVMNCGTRRSPLRIVCVYIMYHLLSLASQRSVPPYIITNSVPLQRIIGLPPSNAYFEGES